MRLKELEIQGFKSFPDKTKITIGEGITGVVGPNGCGKSNIADAVRWVLGEQSAKTLRGAKMEDVIFNGTEKRRRLAFCEVTLVFDNEDKSLPVDYTEVAVTRRVYRSGEGEYKLNGTPCRLRDIIDLFRDTGIGIAPDDLPRIFDRGYTGSTGRSDKRASGLGLYLCRRICRNLGHSISAESTPGKGTLIRLNLEQTATQYE